MQHYGQEFFDGDSFVSKSRFEAFAESSILSQLNFSYCILQLVALFQHLEICC